MNKQELRDELMHQLWRMNKMDLIVSLQEFIEGETATLSFLGSCAGRQVTPSQISDNLHISRARTANILRSLRRKKFVEMCILEDDRRKMCVSLTEAGFWKKSAVFSPNISIYTSKCSASRTSKNLRGFWKRRRTASACSKKITRYRGGNHDR